MSKRPSITAKLVFVLSLPALVALLLHLSLASLVFQGIHERWWLLAVVVLSFCSLLALAGIVGATTRGRTILFTLPIAVAATSLLLGIHWSVLLGFFVEWLALWLLLFNVRREADARLRLSMVKVLAFGMTISLVLILIAITLFTYRGFVQAVENGQLQRSVVDAAIAAVNRVLPSVYKQYSPDITVDDLIGNQLPSPRSVLDEYRSASQKSLDQSEYAQRLRDAGIDAERIDLDKVRILSQGEYEKLLSEIDTQFDAAKAEALRSAREELSSAVGVAIQGDARVEDALRVILDERIGRFTSQRLSVVAPVLSLSLFLTLIIFTGVYTWLVWGIASGAFWVLCVTGIVSQYEETTTVVRYRVDEGASD